MTSKELKSKTMELYESFVKSNGVEPVCASCGVRYLDDNAYSTFEGVISLTLTGDTPEGWDDDDIFFYVSRMDDFYELAEDCGEDFVITDIYELF